MISFKTLYFFHLLVSVGGYLVPSWSVKLPHSVEVLEDSCVLIPCTFNIPDFESELNKSGSVHGFWIKGDHPYDKNPVVFNGTSGNTLLFERIEIIGNLNLRDCSTVFYNVNKSHADRYFFRLEMTHNRATFTETYVFLQVQAALTNPKVLALSDSEVEEGTSLNLTCTAAAPCPYQPPNITWSIHTGNIHTYIQDEGDGRRNLSSFLTFTASRSHHGKAIFCMASYLRHNQSAWEANTTVQTLSVLFSPAVVEASVSPSGAVTEGSNVTLTCNSSEANPPVHNYTWFRDTQTSPVGSGPYITFNVNSSHAGLYYCRAEHPQGAKESRTVLVKLHTDSLPDPNKMDTFLFIGVTGGSLAVLLVVLIIFVARRYKSTPLQPQSSECETSATCDQDGPTQAHEPKSFEDQQEEIHYGEIDFSKLPLREMSQSQEQGLETEYAEVRLSAKHAQTDYNTGTDNEDLYAQVKK